MRVLLHVCCGPCTIEPYEDLVGRGHEVTGYFCNPNIHPFIEFRRRMKAQKVLAERMAIPTEYEERYGLREFLENVRWSGDERCGDCYRLRLSRAAREAARRGFDAVTTTLLSSRHQDHDLVRAVAQECCRECGVEFLYEDWRPRADESYRRARAMNLYMQNYCGCMFSEWERFRNTSRHLYREPGAEGG